jgi:glutamate synthase domain-containing protein 2/glutamate synthase domain-containing protein 1/glutamate synthase domain-containing protein 3
MREHDACGIGFVADARGRASRQVVAAALAGLAAVKHRGAILADARSADGAGLLSPIPAALYGAGRGVAVLFVRGDDPRPAVEAAAPAEGIRVAEWRVPPTDDAELGEQALASRPRFLQALFEPASPAGDSERAAYRLRRRIERAAPAGTYVASCSYRTVVHKGLVPADALGRFWLDLADERFAAPFAVFHQRFSTNTAPAWERAQPFRALCHNGEINAVRGNELRVAGRGALGTEAAGLGPEELFSPLLHADDSDSGKLDAVVELLTLGGRDVRHAVAMAVPPAWEHSRDLDPEVRGFYRYHSALMEPWDGPAGLVFTDGVGVGAALDRNGLRPLRWAVCEDGMVVCCSEAGAVDLSGHGHVERGRLGPGQMLFVDPTRGVLHDAACKLRLAAAGPYARWAADGFLPASRGEAIEDPPDDLAARQAAHGYTKEELAMVLRPMASEGSEPTFSMGDDSPLPHLAGRPRPVAHYLRQRFAQVTNPAIDSLRERAVMSLRTLLGPRRPLLAEGPEAAQLLTLRSPVLYPSAVAALAGETTCPFASVTLDATFPVAEGPAGLPAAVDRLAGAAEAAVAAGAGLVIVDDGGVGPDRAPVPSLLGAGAVHARLVATGRRAAAGLVVVADDVRDVHGLAALVGYGADAVCPRLALQTVAAEADGDEGPGAVSAEAQDRLQAAFEAGLLKVMSKMGISTVDSYRGAQVFEAVGLGPEVVDVCFPGTPSVVGGIGWRALGEDVLARHRRMGDELESPGFYRVRKGGERHGKDKEVVDALAAMTAAHLLQRAVSEGSDERYEAFAALVNGRPALELADLLEPVAAGPAVPVDEVEPAAEIVRRFSTGAMSHGSLSAEAHENLARAMNLIGAMSNCGEGGEDPARFATRGLGRDDRGSRIKQVASGRFGVTPEYLAHADELQIKVAQGSKPGEGGQLPGHKVTREIARLRHTQPGVGLISPPPHHDVYSIEDLAQLVYDLKQVNRAQVSVKLVAESGVGTVAAGVVKALADVVHLSGASGGTGASPLSSIKHAGLPWELGLAECRTALAENGLRGRVRLRVDGGFLTGRHVLVAALLGADEFSFGTAAMIAEGCIMLRACHRDTCKPGVATQRPHLRANFAGTPEGVAAYFLFVAEEVRRLLASLGLRSVDEAVGRADLLRQRATGDPRTDAVDLSPLLGAPAGDARGFVARVPLQDPRSPLGDRLAADAFRAVWDGDEVELRYRITNADRAVGAALGGALALEFGEGRPRGTALARFDGAAGQSFGAFLTDGVELELVGEANDYVGKGMGGGLVVVRPGDDVADGAVPVLAGNTCLYGATGGELFVGGSVGERFAVRNSGAVAVVEGVGDHACEYMTGGTVVVLGAVGSNLGAGMTGGQAFVWDRHLDRLLSRLNGDLVEVVRPGPEDLVELRWLVERHADLTRSSRVAMLLKDWDRAADAIWHVVPKDRVRRIAGGQAGRVAAA